MRAMLLARQHEPLELQDVATPEPGPGQALVRVHACGVCRTDLHVTDGELADPKLPLVLGHQIVGTVEALGPDATDLREGDKVGIPWLGWTCGACRQCAAGRENLCERAPLTGYTVDGRRAERSVAGARRC